MKHLSIILLCAGLLQACVLNLPDPIADMGYEDIGKEGPFIKYDKYSVYSDNNGDKIISKGETIALSVYLKNTGTSKANGVKATFSTTSPYISGLTPTTAVNYGTMVAGSSQYSNYIDNYIRFTVSSSTPDGTQIPINISITDESGNVWTDSFNVTVEAIDTPPNAYSASTWVFGNQTWSDRIVASPSNCTQTNTLSTSDYSATEYKVYDGHYYYSWTCAYNNRTNFCPSPWRMPTQSDFSTLISNTNYSALISAWGYGGEVYGGSMYDLNTRLYYWSSTQYDTNYAYHLYYGSDLLLVTNTYKYYGYQVRCVR
jgi:hypothetical protein